MFGEKQTFNCCQCSNPSWVFSMFSIFKTRCLECRGINENTIHQYQSLIQSGQLSFEEAQTFLNSLQKQESFNQEEADFIRSLFPMFLKSEKVVNTKKNDELTIQLIIQGEGFSETVYKDKKGFPTIGYGHLIKEGQKFDKLSKEEAKQLLEKDLLNAENQVYTYFGKEIIANMSKPRVAVLIDMAYNMGSVRWPKFTQAIKNTDYDRAAKEIMDSNYAKDVGDRAKRNALIMKTGQMASKEDVK